MKNLFVAIAFLAPIGLASCATAGAPGQYTAAPGPTDSGYYEYRVEPGRYRVTFRGSRGASPGQVLDYALLRAAEITQRDGFEWFEVVDGGGEQRWAERGPRVTLGSDGHPMGNPNTSGDASPAYNQTIEIIMGRGARPDRSSAYDAREVRATVRTRG